MGAPSRPAGADGEAALHALAALLEREQAALVAGDPARIEALAQDKLECLQRLAGPGAAAAGDPAERRALLERVRRLNEDNGRLIGWRLGRLGERLAALGAMDAGGTTYDAAGNARRRVTRAPGARASD